ncbi:MAG TPA: hypothetical protein VMJ35_04245 [Dongiaceae bacterium]|nr:hypothetical protein [Dongiaceae bacterium]
MSHSLRGARGFLACALLCTLPVPAQQEPEKDGAGIVFSGQASSSDVGLPLYPHSTPHKDDSNDSQSARFGLWGGGSGFKLAVVKMDSADSPEKVAAFYKKALAKYGKVLDCSHPPASSNSDKDSHTLTCGDDKPDAGGMLFKVGTKEKQHLVSVKPNGSGSSYDIVALGNWSSDKH